MQRTKALDQIVSKVKYAKHLKNEQQSLSNSSNKLKKKKHFLSLSTEASIIFTWNPDNDNVEKPKDFTHIHTHTQEKKNTVKIINKISKLYDTKSKHKKFSCIHTD